METIPVKPFFLALCLLCALMCLALPAAAANGTITIAYRGSGGNYIGDTVIFDGRNTIGNMTVVRMTGPGLPAEGVPPYNLMGTPGSGNSVTVDASGKWVFSWFSSVGDTSALQTGRYTFTASDVSDPERTASTSVVLKKPEFYIVATPAAPVAGDYVLLQGMAERGVTYLKIDILDPSGTIIRTFISPVGNDGSFSHGLRTDISPGVYSIVGSNPSMKKNLALGLTVAAPAATQTTPAEPVSMAPTAAETTGTGPEATVIQTPSRAGIAPATLIVALCLFGLILIARQKMNNR